MDFIILVMRVFLCLVVYPSFVHIQNIMCMSFVQATVSLMSCLFYRANCKNFQQRKMSRVWLFYRLGTITTRYRTAAASLVSSSNKE